MTNLEKAELLNKINKDNGYSKEEIEIINEYMRNFKCPFKTKNCEVHNTIHDARRPHIGLNQFADNDVTLTSFTPCDGTTCMAFDIKNCSCKRC